MKRSIILCALIAASASCGGGGSGYPDDVPTQLPPTVASVEPTSGPVGTTITINGFGYSVAAPNDIVIIGDSAVSAESYALVNPPTATEIESLTATVPAGTPLGANSIVVVVYDNASNGDVTFTVTP